MSSWKLEKNVDTGGLPRFLRELADAVEKGAGGELAGLPSGDLRKLVLVAEQKDGGLTVKLKAKRPHEVRVPVKKAPAPVAPGAFSAARPLQGAKLSDVQAKAREKYRQLKKIMQADYKALQKAAQAGVMPSQDVLESFLALGESMAEMPQPLKKTDGPEATELARANAVFLEDASGLRRAVSARDVKAFAEVLSRLERRKSACHAQFK
jgi:XXXCH domain-containing protein